jgi:hypothetical protein
MLMLPRTAGIAVARVRLDALDRRLQDAIDALAWDAPEDADALSAMHGPLAWLAEAVRDGATDLCDVVFTGYRHAIAFASRALREGSPLSRWAPAPGVLDGLVDAAAPTADGPTRATLHALRAAADALENVHGPTSRAA